MHSINAIDTGVNTGVNRTSVRNSANRTSTTNSNQSNVRDDNRSSTLIFINPPVKLCSIVVADTGNDKKKAVNDSPLSQLIQLSQFIQISQFIQFNCFSQLNQRIQSLQVSDDSDDTTQIEESHDFQIRSFSQFDLLNRRPDAYQINESQGLRQPLDRYRLNNTPIDPPPLLSGTQYLESATSIEEYFNDLRLENQERDNMGTVLSNEEYIEEIQESITVNSEVTLENESLYQNITFENNDSDEDYDDNDLMTSRIVDQHNSAITRNGNHNRPDVVHMSFSTYVAQHNL